MVALQRPRRKARARRQAPGRWRRGLMRGLLGGALLVGLVGLLIQVWFGLHILWWRTHPPASTAFMREQLAALQSIRPDARLRHQWVPYQRIAPALKRAVIAAEDARFVDHDGVDWEAIEQAYERNQRRGRVTHGGSTITMQLAKNLFLSGERSYVRKAQEFLITLMLEQLLSKERILELYLNVAEWGVGVFGAEAAARHHFGVAASQLSPTQAARLAAMLPRPRFYDRNPGSAHLARRAARIARWMAAVDAP